MERGELNWIVVASMLVFDAVAGIIVAVLVSPVIGAITFVVSASISLFTSRSIRTSGGRRGADAPEPVEVAEDPAPAEDPDPEIDPSYNPYARED